MVLDFMRTYIINAKTKEIVFTFEYDSEVIAAIKKVGNARWDLENKNWSVLINDQTKDAILKLVKNHHFHPKVQPIMGDVKWDYSLPEKRYLELEKKIRALDFLFEARPYQIESLGYALDAKSFINGDDMGVGKTFEAILYTEYISAFPCLVVVPASVKYNWAEKWDTITKSKRSISIIESDRSADWGADVVVINYDLIGTKRGSGATFNYPELKSIKWKMAIFDEGHFLKSATSQRSKIARRIAHEAEYVQLLTGTPTSNKTIELWNLLDTIKKTSTLCDGWEDFVIQFCGGYRNRFGWYKDGATNTLQLNKLMRANCYIRREKSEVLTQLPEITTQIIPAVITNEKEYTKAITDFIGFLKETKGEEAAEKAMLAEVLVMMSNLMRLSIEGKRKFIEGYLKDWREADKGKLVIFGRTRSELEYFAKTFDSPLIIGGMTAKKKQDTVLKYINSDQDFLFANIKSAGTGVDGLQDVCANGIIIELPWTPGDIDQVVARLHRSGQSNGVLFSFILSRDTIDMDMWELVSEKEVTTAAINQGVDVKHKKNSLKNIIKKLRSTVVDEE